MLRENQNVAEHFVGSDHTVNSRLQALGLYTRKRVFG